MKLSQNNILSNKTSKEVNLKESISVYTKHWKWFAFSCFVCLVLAFLNLRYTTPEYNAFGKIMIVGNGGVSSPADAILKDLGKISNNESNEILDELEILTSRRLMKEVVKKLSLNIQYFTQGRIHELELYPDIPIAISFKESDSIIHLSSFSFSINATSDTSFDFKYTSIDGEELELKMFFGKNIPTPIGDIIITPNLKKLSSIIGQNIRVNVHPIDNVAEYYRTKIIVAPVAEGSKVVSISLDDPVKVKAPMIINTLIDEYNQASIDEKSQKSKNAADFINDRIRLISKDLSSVDDEIEDFKTSSRLTDITSEANLYLESSAVTEQELSKSLSELNKVNFMKDQFSSSANTFQRVPLNVGLSDGSVNGLALKYNELLNNRDRLLKSSNEKNPIIVNLDEELNNLRNSLNQSLDNTSKTISLQISGLRKQSSKLNSKIYAVPGQVRKSRDIEREQGIKESLYLYLLQKREEATISLISTSANAKVIDKARFNPGDMPVSPIPTISYIAAIIIGMCIPFSIIYIKQLLDNKIHNKEDLQEQIGNITILGEIPRIKSKKDTKLIQKNDRSILSESFRIIRTNFDFVRRGREVEAYNNVIFVTSTINGEGKSFFSINMALTLANAGKRILLVGADIRNPKIHLDLEGQNSEILEKNGLTEYLNDKSVSVENAIHTYEVNGNTIDIMLSGKTPPNPAELLMSNRMKPLFDKVSEQYDYVIVDTAPSMLVTDTLLFSQFAGHTIYMTRAGYTEKGLLNFAKEMHSNNKLKGMMLVVNDVDQSNFGYGARYGYYGTPEKKSWFKKKNA
jgi:tyrosine-protein kinase Etk/Wzc